MTTFKPEQKVTFEGSQRIIFHLIVVKSTEDFTTCRFADTGSKATFHTSDLKAEV